MANYSNLAATINAQIKANGMQAITGPVLNAVLTAMVNVLGDGYRLNGVAVPADNPGSPDNRVAYLAAQDGTYTNFGGLTISGEVALLLWDSAWTKETLFSIDTAVTPGSGNLVTSGAVDSALTTLANNIAAAYMRLVPGAAEGNLAEFDNAGQVRDAGLATTDLATKNGHYPDLFAGFAGNLVDTRSAGTRQQFAFRQSGGDGVNYMRKILGRTEAFNQLVQNGNFANGTTDWAGAMTKSVSNNELTAVSVSGSSNSTTNNTAPAINTGHKYYAAYSYISNQALSIQYPGAYQHTEPIAAAWTRVAIIYSPNNTSSALYFYNYSAFAAGDWTLKLRDVFLIDLTLMYGAGNEPTTVAEFEALHPLPYYNYNAGVLKNNAATGLETTGFNQWDEEWRNGYYNETTGVYEPSGSQYICTKNPVRIIGGATYYLRCPGARIYISYYSSSGALINTTTWSVVYDGNTFTPPANANKMNFWVVSSYGATYKNDICINLSDESRNGEYEPYWKRDIVLGLNNLACHDENNNAVVVNGLDGVGTAQDELVVENGWGKKINKKMAEVDLGQQDWTIMDAANNQFRFSLAQIITGQTYSAVLCPKYTTIVGVGRNSLTDKQICQNSSESRSNTLIVIQDSAFSGYTGAQVAAALAGVKLRFELATPKVLTLDNPIPALIEVDNLGTEKRLPEDTADNPQGPFESDSNYSISTANLVRLLNL